MYLNAILLFVAGIVLVIGGAEMITRGASRVATLFRLSPLLIGLTVVSVGTSAPELAVGITAALDGRGELAVGNIAGTNMLNLLFILGLSALIRPLPLQMLSIKLDLPVMIAAAIALLAMSWDGVLSRFDGLLLIASACIYTAVLVLIARRESLRTKQQFSQEFGSDPAAGKQYSAPIAVLVLIVGLAICVWGADLLVSGAVSIARLLGVSDAIIGLTIVAIGTSAPELATTLVSTFRNDRDVAIGNLIGSSIYNILFILGVTCIVSPGGVHVGADILRFDLPLAAAVAIVCVPVFRSNSAVSRREGAFFVTAYLIYFAFLVIRA